MARLGKTRARVLVIGAMLAVTACSTSTSTGRGTGTGTPSSPSSQAPSGGVSNTSPIKHVIVIMQENRSFDSYFGTYPGADGIPAANGVFTVCVPDPAAKTCKAPYHDDADVNGGAGHGATDATAVVDNGKMDGFIADAEQSLKGCVVAENPSCAHTLAPDVMGYHDAREIPNYWTYAENFVLADHMFEPVASWSLPAHLYMVSAWSALCKTSNPSSCRNAITGPYTVEQQQQYVDQAIATGSAPVSDAWTDITYLLYKHDISWAYYVEDGTQPDCEDDAASCPPKAQSYKTPGIWNPLPLFADVQADGQVHNVQPTNNFFAAAASGTLPAVSWITPSQPNSEHPPASVHEGQAWVTNLVNAVMNGPDWSSTAIFVSWDDWGGFYDHVKPPTVDGNGYGLRVPMLLISPYAKRGLIDHQTLSHDAFLKFIEDIFLGGQRIDPSTDGRPDPRPDVRENQPRLGDLRNDFDFNQAPRAPLILPLSPPPGPASTPGG